MKELFEEWIIPFFPFWILIVLIGFACAFDNSNQTEKVYCKNCKTYIEVTK